MASVRDVMTRNPVALEKTTPVSEAARQMKEQDIGDVVVLDGGNVCGILTDRDIVVRGIAEDRDPHQTTLGDICSQEVVTLGADEPVDRALQLMRKHAIRRLPIVENRQVTGIVSLGDLAQNREPQSVLADVSAAPAQH